MLKKIRQDVHCRALTDHKLDRRSKYRLGPRNDPFNQILFSFGVRISGSFATSLYLYAPAGFACDFLLPQATEKGVRVRRRDREPPSTIDRSIEMSHSRRTRYSSYSRSVSRSRSPFRYSRTVSRSLSRSRSRSRSMDSSDAENPGNNLYVTGLFSRVTRDELEKHFASEGKVVDVHLVVDPWTRESRGFGFVTMSTIEEADSCIKYLNRSVLEGRVITVEKLLLLSTWEMSFASILLTNRQGDDEDGHQPPADTLARRYSSPSYTSDRDRSYSPYYRRRAYSPYYRRRRSRSVCPYSHRRRSYSRDLRSYSSGRSASPYYHRRCERSWSRGISPRSQYHYSCSISPRRSSRRGFSHSYSARDRRSRRSYSRSYSPRDRRLRRSYSRSYSPRHRRSQSYSPKVQPSKRSPSSSNSPGPRKRYSRESYAHSCSVSSSSSSRSGSSARSAASS
ncbi:hypothetical protein MUK42_24945 [Musa troglodytarum]|uniref:RRM domain-containing protein n=1 Tax=Musa troglodytarum TaxID=320322 RepID=A0A9E7I5D7_9LILI|nr:hypothetical protein MUK42_24945 [Musa troglodytarum]